MESNKAIIMYVLLDVAMFLFVGSSMMAISGLGPEVALTTMGASVALAATAGCMWLASRFE